MDKDAVKGLAVRTASGTVLLLLVLVSVFVSPYSFAAFVVVVCIGGLYEFYNIAEKGGAVPQKKYGIAVGALGVAVNFMVAVDFLSPEIWVAFIILLLSFFGIFIAELYRKKGNPLANIAATVTGIMYVALPLSLLSYIAMFPEQDVMSPQRVVASGSYKPWVVLGYIFIVWANDIGAYLFGIAFGKHKLFERISPKKSWEGFFGGVFTAAVTGVVIGKMMEYPHAGEHNILFWAGLSLIVVVTGVLGDLVESMFKRAVSIKDSGNIIPGHGGFLDRFDALLFSVPFVYVYFIIFAH